MVENVEKPWGGFETFALNEPVTVKILFIKKGEALSLQQHRHRDEFWRVLSGNPNIVVGEEATAAKTGDQFEIPRETNHRIEAASGDAEILEISRGEFD